MADDIRTSVVRNETQGQVGRNSPTDDLRWSQQELEIRIVSRVCCPSDGDASHDSVGCCLADEDCKSRNDDSVHVCTVKGCLLQSISK